MKNDEKGCGLTEKPDLGGRSRKINIDGEYPKKVGLDSLSS